MWNFIGGLFLGGTIGFFLAALIRANGKDEEYYYGKIDKNGDIEWL